MARSSQQKRTYTSTRRQSQADQTRRLILEAARKLFYARGYSSASIEAIAQEAGVAADTIYAVFGSKQAILHKLIDITFAGNEEPVPLAQRSFIKEAEKETDQRHLILQFAKSIVEIMTRMSPVFTLLRTTAKTDPDIAALQEKLLKERLGGMTFFVDQLRRIGPLREQILPDHAAVSVWVISSAEVFDLLTRDLGWTQEQYIIWLSDALTQLLLDRKVSESA